MIDIRHSDMVKYKGRQKERSEIEMDIILGSKSPRRKELLSLLGYDFKVVVSEVDEKVTYSSFKEMVLKIASKKAEAIARNYPNHLVIGADTIVVCSDEVLGKPKDKEDCRRMIQLLQGRSHFVYTAVILIYQNQIKKFIEETKVWVTKISDEEIETYINTSEPYDKAGGYAIQGIFSKYIAKINGDYYNVMGLPICHLNKEINKIMQTKKPSK